MKLAIAAFATTLALATGAAAMVGPYERAVNDADASAQLFTQGAGAYEQVQGLSTSPEAEWNNGEATKRSVFSTMGGGGQDLHFGANAR